MSGLAARKKSKSEIIFPVQRGAVVPFAAKVVARPTSLAPPPTDFAWGVPAAKAQRTQLAAEILPWLLEDLEVPSIDAAARARLERLLYFYGSERVTLLVRAIIESDGNENALIEPVITAVGDVMSARPEWPERGLAWIEAFDALPLASMVEVMRELEIFKEESIGRYLGWSLQNKLARMLDPPPAPPKSKPGPKTGRKHNRNTPRYTKTKQYQPPTGSTFSADMRSHSIQNRL